MRDDTSKTREVRIGEGEMQKREKGGKVEGETDTVEGEALLDHRGYGENISHALGAPSFGCHGSGDSTTNECSHSTVRRASTFLA